MNKSLLNENDSSAKENIKSQELEKQHNEILDEIVKLLHKQIKGWSVIVKYLIGFCFLVISIVSILILIWQSLDFNKFASWSKYSIVTSIIGLLDYIPVEIIIIIGFLASALSFILSPIVEKFLLISLTIVALYWSLYNKQWVAFGAALVMVAYIILRLGIFDKYLNEYIKGLAKYCSLIVILLLIFNIIFKDQFLSAQKTINLIAN